MDEIKMGHATTPFPEPQAHEAPTKTTLSTAEDREPPFSLYKEVNGVPFTVKYFDLLDWHSLDKFQLALPVGQIETYISQVISEKHLTDTLESYAAIITELKGKLKIHTQEEPRSAFEKIARYVGRARGKSAYKK